MLQKKLVNYYLKQVFAIAANKSDLFENEAIKESEGRNFAKEIGAVFKCTSAKGSTGIEEIFKNIGVRLIDPDKHTEEDEVEAGIRKKTIKINKNEKPQENGKKKCC